ncbi:MAG: NAAT family transporter [Chlamydiales bacterium]|nr:NAAT family transporter [Chlamydiales bacterium]
MVDIQLFFEITAAFFIIMDPMGNIPVFLTVLRRYDEEKQKKIIWRESVIALAVGIITLYAGEFLLGFLHISKTALQLSGGVILFIIAIRMIFPHLLPSQDDSENEESEPFIVPLAIPCVAGPSLLAMIMIFAHQENNTIVLSAFVCAWLFSTFFFMLAPYIKRILKEKGMIASERLMGFILTLLSIEMFLEGIKMFIKEIN